MSLEHNLAAIEQHLLKTLGMGLVFDSDEGEAFCASGDRTREIIKHGWVPEPEIVHVISAALDALAKEDVPCPDDPIDPRARWGKWHRVCNQLAARLSSMNPELPLGDWSWEGFMSVAGVSRERIEQEAEAERLACTGQLGF